MKQEIRVLGIDDAPFSFTDTECLVVATVFRGGQWMDGVLSTNVDVDGNNATEKLIEMIQNSKFKTQLRALFMDGIALGGFNVIDINRLFYATTIPVIVVIRRMPDFAKLKETLQRLGMTEKYALMEQASTPEKVRVQEKHLFIQRAGISFEKAQQLLQLCCTRSLIPEPLRIAHLIGAGIVKGESSGRA